MRRGIDRTLLLLTIILVVIGFFVFTSASLGLLARTGAQFSSVAFSQILFGIVGGGFALFITSSIHYRIWRQYAFYIFFIVLVLTLLVFIPQLALEAGGAKRWIHIGGFTFQPAEFLKIAFTIYMATWLSGMKGRLHEFRSGTLVFAGLIGIVGTVMLLQPDTDTFLIIAAASVTMFIVAGGRVRDVVLMFILGVLLVAALAYMRPYVKDRIMTFINPTPDPQGSGYQIRQSLIAIGSGGLVGRGYGQSIQKFEYLPEPIGDSIFAVYSEEFGFVGSTLLLVLFLAFTFRGYRIATHAPDLFGMLIVIGLVTLIMTQVLLNTAGMLGLAPLSGLPLPLISHGGTALLATLASLGIILNVSKYERPS